MTGRMAVPLVPPFFCFREWVTGVLFTPHTLTAGEGLLLYLLFCYMFPYFAFFTKFVTEKWYEKKHTTSYHLI